MTQPPASNLLRIEQLLNAGQLREARLLLADYIQQNPASARAWWLLSLTLTDVARQVDCLRRVIRLDPENVLARERLANLVSQIPSHPSVSPFTSSIMGGTGELLQEASLPLPEAAESRLPLPVPEQPAAPAVPSAREPLPPPSPAPQQASLPVTPPVPTLPGTPSPLPFASAGQEAPSPVGLEIPSSEPSPVEIGPSSMPIAPNEPEPVSPSSTTSNEPEPLSDILPTAEPELPSSESYLVEARLASAMPPGSIVLESLSSISISPAEPELPADIPSASETPDLTSSEPSPVETGPASVTPPAPIEPEMPSSIPSIAEAPEPTSSESSPGETGPASVTSSAPVEPELPSSLPSTAGAPEPTSSESSPVEAGSASVTPPAPIEPELPSSIPPVAEVPEPISTELSPVETGPTSAMPTIPSEPELISPLSPLSSEPEPVSSIPLAPAHSEIPSSEAFIPPQTGPVAPLPPASDELDVSFKQPPIDSGPGGRASQLQKPGSRWEIATILLVGIAILAIVTVAGYLNIQAKANGKTQVQAQASLQALNLQNTLMVAQTLTSLPLPTEIPTWTTSPTNTVPPTATFTSTSTVTPTLKYTLTRTPRPTDLIGPQVGLFPPDFKLTDIATGQPVTLSKFEGQPVLLFFWTTSCSPCNAEMSSMEIIFQTYKAAGLVVLSVNAADSQAALSVYRTAHQLLFPILLDTGSVVQSSYLVNADSLPRHFFISSNGRIANVLDGEMTLDAIKLQVDTIMRQYPTATP